MRFLRRCLWKQKYRPIVNLRSIQNFSFLLFSSCSKLTLTLFKSLLLSSIFELNSLKIAKHQKQNLQTIPTPQLFFTILLTRRTKQAVQISRIIYSIETLKVNTICINGNTGNIHIRVIFFVAFIGADYNRCFWVYKIIWFIVLVRVGWWWWWWKLM